MTIACNTCMERILLVRLAKPCVSKKPHNQITANKQSLRWKIKETWLGNHEELYITKVFRTKSKNKCSGSNYKKW